MNKRLQSTQMHFKSFKVDDQYLLNMNPKEAVVRNFCL